MASDSSQSSPATSNPLRGLLGSLNRRRNNRSESGPENQTGLSSPNPDTTEDSPCNSPEDQSPSSPSSAKPLTSTHLILSSVQSESGPENQTGLSSPNPDTTEDSPCNSPEDQSPSSPSSAKPLTSTHLILSSVQSESGPENQTGLSSPNPDTTEDSPCNSPKDQSPSSPSSAKPLTSTHLIFPKGKRRITTHSRAVPRLC